MQPTIVAFPPECLRRRGFNDYGSALFCAQQESQDTDGRLSSEPYTCPHCGLLHLREKAA